MNIDYELCAKIKGRQEIIDVVQNFINDKLMKIEDVEDINLLIELSSLIRIEIDKNSKFLDT